MGSLLSSSTQEQKNIILFLGLYAPDNVVGRVFGILRILPDMKYDNKEIIYQSLVYNIHELYTREHIRQVLGSRYKSIGITRYRDDTTKTGFSILTYFYNGCKNSASSLISIQSKNETKVKYNIYELAYSGNMLSLDLKYKYINNALKLDTNRYISIESCITYHKIVSNMYNGWYAKYYKSHSVNPLNKLILSIIDKIENIDDKILYLLSYNDIDTIKYNKKDTIHTYESLCKSLHKTDF